MQCRSLCRDTQAQSRDYHERNCQIQIEQHLALVDRFFLNRQALQNPVIFPLQGRRAGCGRHHSDQKVKHKRDCRLKHEGINRSSLCDDCDNLVKADHKCDNREQRCQNLPQRRIGHIYRRSGQPLEFLKSDSLLHTVLLLRGHSELSRRGV